MKKKIFQYLLFSDPEKKLAMYDYQKPKMLIKNQTLTARICPRMLPGYIMNVYGTHRRYFKDLICFVEFFLKIVTFCHLGYLVT